jgi:hypothetical protein
MVMWQVVQGGVAQAQGASVAGRHFHIHSHGSQVKSREPRDRGRFCYVLCVSHTFQLWPQNGVLIGPFL